MARISYLEKRGSTYYARLDVPIDLVKIVGTTCRKQSLRTKEEAVAKRLVHAVIEGWQREFSDLRSRSVMTPADKDHAVWDHYTEALDRDEAERTSLPTEADIDATKAEIMRQFEAGEIAATHPLALIDATIEVQAKQSLGKYASKARAAKLADLRKHIVSGNTVLVTDEVADYLSRNRLIAEPGSPDFVSMARGVMRAEIEALQRGLERDQGDYGGTPRDPLVTPAKGARRVQAVPGEGLMEVFEKFARENPRKVAPDRINQSRRDVALFGQVVGLNFPVSRIDKKAVREWKGLLIEYPVKATETNAFKNMTMQQTIKANVKVGRPVIADRTVNRYLSSLGAFCDWMVKNGYLDQNPVEGMALPKEDAAKTLPFDSDQMNTLFKSPWFAGCQSETEWRNVAKPGNVLIRDHRYWVPLIMLFSGARPGEIGQLAVNDVRQEHGHWIMHITTEGDETDQGKKTKTKGSMRVVPLHPEVIKLGFLDYHAERKRAGGNALFPGAVRNERGQMMADVSREFGRYLTRIGLKDGRGLSLYSFRHGATDALRRGGYLDHEFGFILGHAEASMTGKYGQMPQGMLEQRVKLIEAIAYPGLDLSHLVPK